MKEETFTKFIFINCLIVIIISSGCGKHDIGIKNGNLLPCPNSPNCVSSCETDSSHFIEPLAYNGSPENAKTAILSVLDFMSGAKVIVDKKDYIHAECTSTIFRFVDDLEFQFVEGAQVINVRSASRVGYSDLGVNKKRVEEIRKKFNETIGLDAK